MAVAARSLETEYTGYVRTHSATMRVYTHRAPKPNDRREVITPQIAQQANSAPIARADVGANVLRSLLTTIGVLAAAAAVLLLLVRYAAITEQYAVVNDLKAVIEENERALTELNVELNSAVSLQQAREAALQAGLGYPSAEQIVRID